MSVVTAQKSEETEVIAIPKTMKAAVLHGIDRMAVEEVPVPEIDDESALMRVEACCVCGSDIRILHHGNPRVIPPTVTGHEASGVIVKTGAKVSGLKVGDRVSIAADVPCGLCDWCRNGLGNNCEINYAVGYQIPGAFAEYMKIPQLICNEGPIAQFADHLSFEEAALAEPLACAINGLEVANMSLGKTVVIIGLGPIGCMMIDLARNMGAQKVIGIQRSAKRMEIAKFYNADLYLASEHVDVVRAVMEATGGRGADVIVTTSSSVEAHEQAVEMVAHRGYVNLFGGLGKDARPMSLYSNKIHYRESFLTGSHGSVPRQHKLALRLLESGQVRVKPLITHRFPLSEIKEAFAVMESRQGMKIVVEP
ncbi:MAG: alcohol dehydrogenase catalytic domain-containing protein [Acidobacteriaceae bacterium]|nr:alcohol dehydrogenase catalytic domain-containing protein [Acidobacteriaceae bacterium]